MQSTAEGDVQVLGATLISKWQKDAEDSDNKQNKIDLGKIMPKVKLLLLEGKGKY